MAVEPQGLTFALQKLFNSMKNYLLQNSRGTRKSTTKFRFENYILVQATQDLNDLLKKQGIPLSTQSSQNLTSRQVYRALRQAYIESIE
jgi:hypothetical protein